jgi:hypothetical protein
MQPFQAAWINRSTGDVCGLYFTTPGSWQPTRHYLPQVKLESHTTITSVCYTTTLSQTFNNPSQDAVSQARYTFPLYDGVAVSAYTITYGDNTLKGIVQHKEKAKKTYDAAVERGEAAGLLESLPAGVFGVTLRNLPAKTDVHVDIVYCGELRHDAAIDGLRYMLPTSIAPRYGEYPGELLKSTAVNRGGVSIVVDVDMNKNAIRKVQSPSHPIAVSLGTTSSQDPQAAFNQSKASATLTLGTTELAGDFVLQLLIDDISKPQAIVEQHPDLPSRAIMATFVPKFNLETSYPEIVFIADQSGSMGGDNNTALVSALKIFLKSLPVGVHFNIIAFGSDFKALWPKSQAYNEGNVKAAIAFVDTFHAQYGGTEILQPVEAAFEQRLDDMALEIMLLTDGEIWKEQELFKPIASQVGKKDAGARVFTLGVGSRVSHTLVEGVARAGNGFAQFVTQGEETDRKVVRMLKGALYPHLKDQTMEINYSKDADQSDATSDDDFELVEKVDYSIDIENLSPPKSAERTNADVAEKDNQKDQVISLYDAAADLDTPIKAGNIDSLPAITTPNIIQAPNQLPSLFPFNRTTVYLLLGSDAPQKKISSITFRATSPQGPLELTIDVAESNTDDTTIHQLAARKAIQDLEEGRGWLQTAEIDGVLLKNSHKNRFDEFIEREAVRIGELYQVAGKWTSFVAVSDKNKDQVDGATKDDTRERDPPHPFGRAHGGFSPYSSSSHQPPAMGMGMARKRMVSQGMSPMQNMAMQSMPRVGGTMQMPTSGGLFSTDPAASSGAFGSLVPTARKCKRSASPRVDSSGARPVAKPTPATDVEEEDSDEDDEMGFGLFDDDDDDSASAAAMPNPPPPAGKRSALHDLIGLQNFVGAWDWTDELFKIIGKEVTFDADAFTSKHVMATALAVAFLESKLAASKDVWEMVVAKAKGWMVYQGIADAERVVEAAKGLI